MSVEGCNKPRRQYYVVFFFLSPLISCFVFFLYLYNRYRSCSFSNGKTTDRPRHYISDGGGGITNSNNSNKWICSENGIAMPCTRTERLQYTDLVQKNDSHCFYRLGKRLYRSKALTTLSRTSGVAAITRKDEGKNKAGFTYKIKPGFLRFLLGPLLLFDAYGMTNAIFFITAYTIEESVKCMYISINYNSLLKSIR